MSKTSSARPFWTALVLGCMITQSVWAVPFAPSAKDVTEKKQGADDPSFALPAPQSNFKLIQFSPAPLPPTSVSLQCKLETLQKIGWKIRKDPRAKFLSARLTQPCDFASPEAAHQAGELILSIPDANHLKTANDRAIFERDVNFALKNQGSLCLYSMRLAPAIASASTRLRDNHMYMFNTPFGWGDARLDDVDGWERKQACSENQKCFTPKAGANAQAMSSLYTSTFASECGTGLQLAGYASTFELFGPQEFNRRFTPAELFVGAWKDASNSASVIYGVTGRRVRDELGTSAYLNAGSLVLTGVMGYMGNVKGWDYLDKVADQGENFIIVQTTPRAAAALSANGGLNHYTKLAERVWQLSHGVSSSDIRTLENANGNDMSVAGTNPRLQEIQRLLADPFMSESYIYVHDVGIQTFRYHILRLLRINPRTPYKFFFYADSLHAEIFDRWVQMQLESCSTL